MKKTLLIILLIIPTVLLILGLSILTKIDNERDICEKINTSECYLNLLNKYSYMNNMVKNFLRYDYAYMLLNEKEYQKALDEFDYILSNEEMNTDLISDVKKEKQKTLAILKEISEQEKLINADYYNKKDTYKWKKTNLKVFINTDNTQLQNMAMDAFSVYTKTFDSLFKFKYVQQEKDADITVKFTDTIKDKGGYTNVKGLKDNANNKYMYKADIAIALKPFDKDIYYTNSELLNFTIHEIGHALGVVYHSDSPNDIMYHKDNYRKADLSKKDINTIKRIYKK